MDLGANLRLSGAIVLTVATLLSEVGCGDASANAASAPRSLAAPPFKVVVVGEKVSSDCLDPVKRKKMVTTDPAAADGCSVAAGADAAYKVRRVAAASKHFSLEYRDDKKTGAVETAKRIQADPEVLAVIGHTSSENTRIALPIYAQADIPVLLPVATSPNVVYPHPSPVLNFLRDDHWDTKTRLSNAFRLIPNDSLTQAPALALSARNLAKGGPLVLVGDVTDNEDYVNPLYQRLQQLLSLSDRNSLKLDTDSLKSGRNDPYNDIKYEFLTSVLDSKPNLVIFCGTKERAEIFLKGITDQAKAQHIESPSFLFSDNSRMLSNIPAEVNAYVTFPVPSLPKPDDNEEHKAIADSLVYKEVQSYEMFSFDSVLLLATAIDKIEKARKPVLNREALREALERQVTELQGVEIFYRFLEHENAHASYYVYSKGPAVHAGTACGESKGSELNSPSALTFDCELAGKDLDRAAHATIETVYAQIDRVSPSSLQHRMH